MTVISRVAAVAVVLLASEAGASTFTGSFSGTMDLGGVGGVDGTAYSVAYSFDPADPGTDLGPLNNGREIFSYGGIDGTAAIGTATFSFTGARILIENDNALPFDSYLFSTRTGTTTGTLFGRPLDSLDFQLFDLTATALSGTSLVTTDFDPLDFSNVQTFVEFADDTDGIADGYTFTPISTGSEFSLTFSPDHAVPAIPLPAALPFLLTGLVGFGLLARRRPAG